MRVVAGAAFAAMMLLGSAALADTPAPSMIEAPTILYNLKGLRLIDSNAKLVKSGYRRPGITIDGPRTLYNRTVLQQLQKVLGKPFSAATMQRVTDIVSNWYQAQDRFVDVSFPEQDISGGAVQAVVTLYRLGDVHVTGADWFAPWLARSAIGLDKGDIIDARVLNDDLAWLNQNTYRQVKVVMEKSQTPGEADLTLQQVDRFPFRFSAGFNNGGVPVIGRDQWSAGIEWANAFFLGQDLSYQFSSSDDFWVQPQDVPVEEHRASFEGHQLSWTIPLPWHDRFLFFGDYDELRPRLGPFFTQLGISWQTSGRYVLELPSLDNFTEEAQFGYDFKRSNNNLAFGGFAVSKSSTEIDQFPATYNAAIDDGWGRTILFDQFVYSPGNLTGGNNDAAFQPSQTQSGVMFAHANYIYGDVDVTRVTRLPFDATSILKAQVQLANSNLLSSEQLGAGGVESVRGYDERAASGSEGLLLSSEFRSPPFGIVDPLFGLSTGDQFQADAFWDFGHIREHKNVPGSPDSQTLQSVGAGLHYTLGRFVDLRFEYGWQLRKAFGEKKRGSEPYLSLNIGN